jgi:rubrerythrin
MNEKKWRCTICGYVHVGQRPPSHCPICGVGAGMFEEVKEKVPEGVGLVMKMV